MIIIKWHKWLLGGFLGLIGLGLFGCRGSHSSVYINDVSFSPDPVVGQVIDLSIEAISEEDFEHGEIGVLLPTEVQLISGNLTWNGPFFSEKPQFHELSICVTKPGVWEIIIGAGARDLENDISLAGYSLFFYLESGLETAQVLTGEQYIGKYRDRWPQNTPTHLPPSIDVVTTCIENGEG